MPGTRPGMTAAQRCDMIPGPAKRAGACTAGMMPMSLAAAAPETSARALYDKLEDRVLARDQVGASETYYDLARRGRPLPEMLREAVRIHGPYTHVPY